MSHFTRPLTLLALTMASLVLYSLIGPVWRPWLGLASELDYYIVNKGLFAVLLLGLVVSSGLRRQAGLVLRANWRTLPLYWPVVLILGLIWADAPGLPSGADATKILAFCIAGVFIEELIFRGLVFHWFRELPVRSLVLLSASSLALVHLVGFNTEMHPAVVLSQVYFVFALGVIFSVARARDVSILLPFAVHVGFDFFAILPKGSVSQTFENVPQMVTGMLFAGTIALAWGLAMLWKSQWMTRTTDSYTEHAEHFRQVSA